MRGAICISVEERAEAELSELSTLRRPGNRDVEDDDGDECVRADPNVP